MAKVYSYYLCAYRKFSYFLWGNVLYTGMVVEELTSVEDAPSAPGQRQISSHASGFRLIELS